MRHNKKKGNAHATRVYITERIDHTESIFRACQFLMAFGRAATVATGDNEFQQSVLNAYQDGKNESSE